MAHSNSPFNSTARTVVVNADATQLNALCGLLEKAGLEPMPFKSAETALTAMRLDPPPALIVTDLYMPGIDGWRFCRLLRSPEYAPFNQTPILVVSATFSGDEPARITSDLGANAFLSMPVDEHQFIEQTQALLKGDKPRDVLTALIVEDSELIAKRLTKAFQAHGYRADAAFTYQTGLAMIKQTAYDVAVLDYHLPDGLADGLLKDLQAKSPDGVCILITADQQPELALTWMKMGAAASLRKPFEPEYLIAQCERARRERALLRVQDLLEVRTRQLQKSEERFRNLSDDIPVCICSFLPDSTMTYVNSAQAALTAMNPAELVGRRFFDLLDPLDRENVRKGLETLTPNNPTETHDQAQTAPNGSKRYLEWRNRAFFDENGKACRFLGTGVDITERKQAEEALRASEERFRGLLQSVSSVSVQGYGLDGTTQYWNQASERIYGYTAQEAIGRNLLELIIPPEMRAAVKQAIQQMAETGQPIPASELSLMRSDGSRVVVFSSHAIVQRPGHAPELFCIDIDLTERKQAEEALRKSEERFYLIDQASQDQIYSYDRQGRFTHANSMLCRRLGLKPEQIIGKTHVELGLPQEQCDQWARYHQWVYATQSTVISEMMIPIQGGPPQYFEVVLNPIHAETGAVIGIAGTTRDITERKRAEAKINEQLDELRRWHNVTLGREDRILDLKREVNRLLVEAGKPARYASAVETAHE